MIDNYDSFTYNLVNYLRELRCEVAVYLNDAITIAKIKQLKPSHIIISPGPGNPNNAGISLKVIEHLSHSVPILGVCLGHQCLGHYFGANIINAPQIIHGKTSVIHHRQQDLFHNMPLNFRATRYHSLIIDATTLPPCLTVTAWSYYETAIEIMAISHRYLPLYGVQFHPEAILTQHGHQLLENFLQLSS